MLKQIFLRDYPTFSGIMLKRYFRQQAIESKRQAKNIDMDLLRSKTDYFLSVYLELQSYQQELLSLSLQDIL